LDVWGGGSSFVSPDVGRKEWRKEINDSNALGGHGELSKGSGVTARVRTSCLRAAQMKLVALECASNPGRLEKILATEPARLKQKVAVGSAVGIIELSKHIPAPPLRAMGCLAVGDDSQDDEGCSGVSTDPSDSEEDECLLSGKVRVLAHEVKLADFHGMYDEKIAGAVVLESGDVLKIVGRDNQVFYAFKIGIEKDVDKKLATMALTEVRGTFLGSSTIGKRYNRMPRPSSDLLKLIPIVGLRSISGPPSFTKEKLFFNTDNTNGNNEYSPMKYKCLEYVDWDLSPPRQKASNLSASNAEQQLLAQKKAKKAKKAMGKK
jgi:hypothetical protein